MTWEMSVLVICEIVCHFSNTLKAGHRSSLRNSENLPKPIQMQLSKK